MLSYSLCTKYIHKLQLMFKIRNTCISCIRIADPRWDCMCIISDPPFRPLIQVSSKHNTGNTLGLYTEGETLQLECKSMGGYPAPRLEGLIDQEPVESRFVRYLFGYTVHISNLLFLQFFRNICYLDNFKY